MSDSEAEENNGGVKLRSTKSTKRKHSDDPEIEINLDLPEPASKRAKRLEKKQKKTPKRPTQTVSKNTSVPDLTTAATTLARAYFNSDLSQSQLGPQIAQKRSEYGIWIGNLSFKTTRDSLRRFLSDEAGIEGREVVRLHLPTTPDAAGGGKAQNKGFAYIDFATKEGLDKALALSERLLDGRRVLIKDAKNFDGRPIKPSDSSGKANGVKKEPSKRVWVGNLGFDVTKEELAGLFRKAGEVEDVFLATFEDTGKCKGFGWVRFADVEAATAAVKGYVLYREDGDDGSDDGEEMEGVEVDESGDKPHPSKKQKKVKHWINRLHGRQIKVEFAEDAQTRYKKRFGKDKDKDTTNQRHSKAHEARSSPDYDIGRNAVTVAPKQLPGTAQTHQADGAVETQAKPLPLKVKKEGGRDRERRREDRRKRHEKLDARGARAQGEAIPKKASGAIVAAAGKKMKFDD